MFLALLVVGASMTFLQLGFVGLGAPGDYVAYLMALLCPIAVSALLLGWKSGALMGLACGTVLLAHSRLMPLDLIEGFLIGLHNSVFLYAGTGLFLGVVFDAIRRLALTAARRRVAIAVVCMVASLMLTILLDQTMVNERSTYEQIKVYVYTGDLIVQFWAMACSRPRVA